MYFLEVGGTLDCIVEYEQHELGSIVERMAGEDGRQAWNDNCNDPDVGPEQGFPNDDDEIFWEIAKC